MVTRTLRALLSVVASLALAGCAPSLIPPSIRQQAVPGVTFQDVLKNPENYKGKNVLWGGKILALSNHKEGTRLQLLQIPVDSKGEPLKPELSEGRFLVFFPERYLDREIYAHGRLITVLGQVSGQEVHALGKGELDYAYPVLTARELYLWPERRPYRGWGYPYDTFWMPGYYWDYGDTPPVGLGLSDGNSGR